MKNRYYKDLLEKRDITHEVVSLATGIPEAILVKLAEGDYEEKGTAKILFAKIGKFFGIDGKYFMDEPTMKQACTCATAHIQAFMVLTGLETKVSTNERLLPCKICPEFGSCRGEWDRMLGPIVEQSKIEIKC